MLNEQVEPGIFVRLNEHVRRTLFEGSRGINYPQDERAKIAGDIYQVIGSPTPDRPTHDWVIKSATREADQMVFWSAYFDPISPLEMLALTNAINSEELI